MTTFRCYIKTVVFKCLSLMISDLNIFTSSHFYVFEKKRSLLKSFAHVLIELLRLFCYLVVCVPYTFWILTPREIPVLQIVSPIL